MLLPKDIAEIERLEELIGNAIARLDELERFTWSLGGIVHSLKRQVKHLREQLAAMQPKEGER